MTQRTTISYDRTGAQQSIRVDAFIHTVEHVDILIAQLKKLREIIVIGQKGSS